MAWSPIFQGTFIPYLWLGNERQGLCWFADNDRDWLPDDIHSTHAIYRQGKATLLVIHFVTKPGRLKREHNIVFGLQATPTKPMPSAPRDWRKTVFGGRPDVRGLRHVVIIGASVQWGADSFYSVYPRNRDYSIFDVFRQARSGHVPRSELSNWIAGYDTSRPGAAFLGKQVSMGVGNVLARPDVVVPYFNARGVPYAQEELQTFQDEWTLFDYSPSRVWPRYLENDKWGYEAVVPQSRQDCILWYLNKMLDSRAFDSIYFDCTYLRAVRQTVSANAYRDENGTLRPTCELFALRELFKRCAVLVTQKRGYNMNVAHMTTVEVAPLQTWFGVNLDWEARFGRDDFQDRFSREYIRVVTLGQHCGTIPLVLGSLGIAENLPREDKARLLRTLAGTILAHEVKDWALNWGKVPTYDRALAALYRFGYGEPDCHVYNYWQDGYPVRVTGADTASLLLVRGGEALLVVTDYNSGGVCGLQIDGRCLGINPDGIFTDAENGANLPKAGQFGCRFRLRKHDFMLLHYH